MAAESETKMRYEIVVRWADGSESLDAVYATREAARVALREALCESGYDWVGMSIRAVAVEPDITTGGYGSREAEEQAEADVEEAERSYGEPA